MKQGDNVTLQVGSNGNLVNFSILEARGDSYLLWCTHGDWEGIYDPTMKALVVLSDSYGWLSEDQRVMKTIFGVNVT